MSVVVQSMYMRKKPRLKENGSNPAVRKGHSKTKTILGEHRLNLIVLDVHNDTFQTALQIFSVVQQLIWRRSLDTITPDSYWYFSSFSWPHDSLFVRHSMHIKLQPTCASKGLKI